MNQLSIVENQQLTVHEQVIARGLKTFVEVGEALQAIRDNRLYREQYDTFEDYCQERWGLTSRHVNQTIAASRVVNNLGTIVPVLPATESQARPLTGLEASQQREVWQAAVESAPNGRVTAAHVERTKQQVAYGNFDDGWGDYDEDDTPTTKSSTVLTKLNAMLYCS